MIKIDGYAIDCAVEERLTYESEVTEFPVEKGANVTDHVRAKKPILEIDAVVSDTPTGVVAQDVSRQTLEGAVVPSRDALDFFQRLHSDRRAVTVECSLGRFDDLVMTSLTPVRNKDTLKALKFSATFTTIEFAVNARRTIRVATPSAGKRSNLGTLMGLVRNLKVIHVASFPYSPERRARFLKRGWKLVSTTTHAQRIATLKAGGVEGFGMDENNKPREIIDPFGSNYDKVDHFDAGQFERSDGFVAGNNHQDYYPYVSHSEEAFIGTKSVRYDYATGSWVDNDSNRIVKKVPSNDIYKGVTKIFTPGSGGFGPAGGLP